MRSFRPQCRPEPLLKAPPQPLPCTDRGRVRPSRVGKPHLDSKSIQAAHRTPSAELWGDRRPIALHPECSRLAGLPRCPLALHIERSHQVRAAQCSRTITGSRGTAPEPTATLSGTIMVLRHASRAAIAHWLSASRKSAALPLRAIGCLASRLKVSTMLRIRRTTADLPFPVGLYVKNSHQDLLQLAQAHSAPDPTTLGKPQHR